MFLNSLKERCMFPAAMREADPIERVCAIWVRAIRPYPVKILTDSGRQPMLFGDGFNQEWYILVGDRWLDGDYPWKVLAKWERDVRKAREFERHNGQG